MVYLFLLFFTFIGLSLQGITPQKILDSAQHLYAALENKGDKISKDDTNAIMERHHKMYIDTVTRLEQARDIAKERKDTVTVQNLTERVIEAKKNFLQRHPLICTVLMVSVCSYLSYCLGRRMVYQALNILD